jgi:hypothetical protein
MKKSVLALAMAFGVTSAFAQDLTSKKGEPILPEAGDWAIGVEANPFLNYLGNAFNNSTSNTAPTWNFGTGQNTIIGKMFKDEKTAYRAVVRLGLNSQTERAQIGDASVTTPTPFPGVATMKEDKWKHSETRIGLGAGMEMRRGKTRLQGYYGGEVMIWMSSEKDKYTYGNSLVAGGSNPVGVNTSTTTDFGSNYTTNTEGGAARITEWKSGSTIGFGIRGFVGAEYFILPKISLGGEFGWGIGISSMGKSSTTHESIGGTGPSVGTQTIEGAKSGSLTIDTDQTNFGSSAASLRLMFHF